MDRRLSGLPMVVHPFPADEGSRRGKPPPEPRTRRQPRLGRSLAFLEPSAFCHSRLLTSDF